MKHYLPLTHLPVRISPVEFGFIYHVILQGFYHTFQVVQDFFQQHLVRYISSKGFSFSFFWNNKNMHHCMSCTRVIVSPTQNNNALPEGKSFKTTIDWHQVWSPQIMGFFNLGNLWNKSWPPECFNAILGFLDSLTKLTTNIGAVTSLNHPGGSLVPQKKQPPRNVAVLTATLPRRVRSEYEWVLIVRIHVTSHLQNVELHVEVSWSLKPRICGWIHSWQGLNFLKQIQQIFVGTKRRVYSTSFQPKACCNKINKHPRSEIIFQNRGWLLCYELNKKRTTQAFDNMAPTDQQIDYFSCNWFRENRITSQHDLEMDTQRWCHSCWLLKIQQLIQNETLAMLALPTSRSNISNNNGYRLSTSAMVAFIWG